MIAPVLVAEEGLAVDDDALELAEDAADEVIDTMRVAVDSGMLDVVGGC